MRIILLIILFASAAYLGILIYNSPSCSKPLTYRIGTLDPRFGLTSEELKRHLEKAELIWEKPAERNLFASDEEALLLVDFIFDERQMRTLDARDLDARLETLEDTQTSLEKEYGETSALYQAKLEEYQKEVSEYSERVKKFNSEVAYWNREGGAPEKEYEELQKEEKSLEKIADDIETLRKRLNEYATKTGTLADKDRALVECYNKEVATFEETYGRGQEFDQGVFSGSGITIYQFEDEADLVLALAHELGHALGIGHVNDPEAIMYPIMGGQNLLDPRPREADLAALDQACRDKEFFLLHETRRLLPR